MPLRTLPCVRPGAVRASRSWKCCRNGFVAVQTHNNSVRYGQIPMRCINQKAPVCVCVCVCMYVRVCVWVMRRAKPTQSFLVHNFGVARTQEWGTAPFSPANYDQFNCAHYDNDVLLHTVPEWSVTCSDGAVQSPSSVVIDDLSYADAIDRTSVRWTVDYLQAR